MEESTLETGMKELNLVLQVPSFQPYFQKQLQMEALNKPVEWIYKET